MVFCSLIILFISFPSLGQIVLLSPTGDGGFETGTTFAANGWTVANDTRSKWEIGTAAVSFAGTNCIYTINNTAGTWAYQNSASRASHFYRDIAIPAGATNIVLSFYWKGSGEAGFDQALVSTAPAVPASIPLATTAVTFGSTNVWTQPNVQMPPPVYTLASVNLPNTLAGTTVRLIFTWRNDASLGALPGAAFDNIGLTYIAAAPCAGTPNAGTAVISASSGCAATNFTLTATGLSNDTGISYQWQSSSSATGPWTNIAGANAPTLTTSASSTTFYQLVSTCANGGATNVTNSVSYSVNTCAGSITMTDSFGDGWNGATMTLNVNGAPFAVFGPTLTTGTTQTINFCLPPNSSYSLVYTSGGTFPGEVGVSFTIDGLQVYSAGAGVATVGATLVSGVACAPPCSGTPNAGLSSITSSIGCPSVEFTLLATGLTGGAGITYQWQSSPTGLPGTWSNIASANAPSFATSVTATTYFQLVTSCSNGGASSVSNAVSYTVSCNDFVCDATPISCGQTLSGSTIGATNSGTGEAIPCGVITPTQPGVWYVVPGGGQIMTASLCGTSTWDSYIQVFSGADCNSLNCVDGVDDSGPACAGVAASVTWNAQIGLNYYIFVSGFSTNSSFNLALSCVTPPPPVVGCSGVFTDSGGATGNYNPNQTQIFTYCPGVTGGRVRMSFTQFDLQNGFDFLTIYDGASTSSPNLGTYTGLAGPGIVEATLTNGTGCLTFVFQSDDITQNAGWSANISCIQPCQTIVSNLVSTAPVAQVDGIIRICQGQQVTFNGNGTFSQTGTGATYNWSFGDGLPLNGTTVTQTFSAAGTYIANLNIEDPNGCLNTNRLNVIVQVSTTPTISPTITPNSICLGQTANATAAVAMTPFVQNCTPPISGTTFLPDGSGVSYQTSIGVDCYTSNQVVTSASDIQNICLNVEHSYLGDLNIAIVCPNGQSAILKSYPGGGGTYLGCPLDDPAVGPGIGAQYCFNSTATTLLVNAPNGTNCGTPAGATLLTGTYRPVQPFTNLVGCPLNGQWTIQVTDNLGADNGYIFNWDINFNPALLPPTSITSFTPSIVSQGWQPATGLATSAGSSSATVTPTATGSNCYTYSVTDNFGCSYNQQACVNVINNITATVNSATICSGASATITATPVPAGTYNYAWTVPSGATNPGNVASFNATVAGTYTVVISTQTTPACASAPTSGTLTVGATMTVSANQVTTACHNLPLSPVIVFTTTGATGIGLALNLPPGLTASFAGNATAGTITISGTPTVPTGGSFSYTIPLAGGCGTVNAQGTITVNVPPLVPTVPGSLCAGTSNTLTVSGGTAGSQLSWTTSTGGSGTATIGASGSVSFGPGSFSLGATWPAGVSITFTQVSLNGCTVPVNLVVTIASSITATVTATTPICSGASTTLTFSGTPSATVTYNIGGGANQLINLGPTGTVSSAPIVLTTTTVVTVTQVQLGSSCTQALSNAVNIVVNPTGSIPVFSAIGPYCYGVTAPPLPTISTNNVSGTWSPATVNTNVVGITNYTFTPTGTCPSAPVVIAVTVNERPLVFAHGTNPTCSNLCNGSAVVDVTGGTAPYTYSWSNGGVTATIPNLCVGTYNVTVTDANGCQSQAFTPVTGCFQIQGVLVNSCADVLPATEQDEEMVFFQVGSQPLNTALLSATWPTLADTWRGLCPSNPAYIAAVNATITGGGVVLPMPVSGILPSNANVVLLTSNVLTAPIANYSALSDTLYMIFQCPGNTQGHFGNNLSAVSNPLILNFGAGCSDQVTYNGPSIGGNGSYVLYSSANSPTYLNFGCFLPYAIQDNSINLTAPDPIIPTFTAVGPFCSGAAIPALPISSTNTPAITGTWNPAISNTTTTTYTFTPTSGLCASSTTLPITITPLNTASAPSSNPTLCLNTVLPAITITTTGATGIDTPSGLPNGVTATWSNNVISISGTPSEPGTFNYSIPLTGGCGEINASGTIVVSDIIDYANLQFPGAGTICANSTFNAFGQLYNTGAVNTPGAGAATGVTVQIGYSTTNSDPSTWTNWSAANYNPAVTGNNDEYQGTLSGLAIGTYYYTFRYQINGCAWQYGGYSASGGGFWNGTCTNCNVNGQLNVIAIPDAGNDATLNLCANGTTLNLYNSLGALAANTGVWTGPSSLTGGYLGTFNPASNTAGVYKYKVSNGTCADSAFVTVVIGAAPTATITYSSPLCATAPLSLSPIIVGSTGPNPEFAISPTTGVSIGATTGVVTSSGNPTPGTYTVTYTIPANATTGCTAFVTTAQIVVTAAPAVPTLTPASFCANTPLTFIAGNGSVYEFFVNGVSQGTPSSTATFNSAGVAAGVPVCVRSYPQVPVLDGNIVGDAAVWGAPLATSAGGAVSATGNRIDGLFLRNMNNVLYGAVAGAEIDGTTQAQNYRVLLFLDTKPSVGFNSLAAWTDRNGVPVGAPAFQDGIKNLSSGITFDTGFAPDYILAMNCANSNTPSTAYFDLYDMNNDVNVYLGSGTNVAGAYGYQANAAAGALDKGFEFGVPMALIGSPTGSFKVFAMLVNDPNSTNPTTVSNQFLTRANPGQNDFGSGNIDFNNEPPNPIVFALGSDCYTETCVSGTAPAIPEFGTLGPFCNEALINLPSISNNNISGSWSQESAGSNTYIFTPTVSGPPSCASTQIETISILPQILTTLIFHN
jgi:subtilisin-like proprotein convertase family protein